jgi:uncharacterized membrane-anchored protein YjiN (DUF445 family)
MSAALDDPTERIAPPPVKGTDARRARLRVMKRRATAMLLAVSIVFVVVTLFGRGATWATYVQAMAEAAMIGGLADWFAVTALFRHPLGIPIPHTAIIAARKEQFASTLGEFIQETFLTPDAIVARLHRADPVSRLSAWLTDEHNADRVARELLDGAVTVADLFKDEDVHRAIEGLLHDRLDAVELAPTAGKALGLLVRDGRHQQVLDTALRELDRYLDNHRDDLRSRLGAKSPWWLPGAAEDRIVDRLVEGGRAVIAEMLEDREHHLRQRFDDRVRALVDDLQTSPDLLERGEKLKRELLQQPQVNEWVGAMWADAKQQLSTQAADPASPLRQRVAQAVTAAGARLRDDEVLAGKAREGLDTAATYVIDRFQGEIVNLVRDTIGRWDAEETADRLELLLGPDLQYIRINGTVVGALAGLVLHTIAQLLS